MLVTILEVGDAINGSYVSDPLRVRKVFCQKVGVTCQFTRM